VQLRDICFKINDLEQGVKLFVKSKTGAFWGETGFFGVKQGFFGARGYCRRKPGLFVDEIGAFC